MHFTVEQHDPIKKETQHLNRICVICSFRNRPFVTYMLGQFSSHILRYLIHSHLVNFRLIFRRWHKPYTAVTFGMEGVLKHITLEANNNPTQTAVTFHRLLTDSFCERTHPGCHPALCDQAARHLRRPRKVLLDRISSGWTKVQRLFYQYSLFVRVKFKVVSILFVRTMSGKVS